ncbi:efflux RND transporter periplasmic adaptor subunit [Roseobacter sp. HKCCA0882]|uniref:efflux RND transporter periplasmic adaptor subunit n=1 Tax=Roseobacter sp. HKCCA0882 TaxID=3120337 RepID=UPI0030EF4DB6
MRIFPVITALLVCAALYVLIFQRDALMGRDSESPAAAEAAQMDSGTFGDAMRVVILPSHAEVISDAVRLRGRSEAARFVEIRAETSGRIISDPIKAGQSVTAGDILCQIDEGTRAAALAEAEAARSTAEAQLAAAQIDANAATRLSESGFASETRAASAAASLSSAEAALRSAEAAIDRAAEELARIEIRAPFNGLLESDTAELGTLMQPGALCATVIDLDPIKFVGFLPEAELARISIGQLATTRLVNGREVDGIVRFVARSADPQTRTFRVEIEAENPDLSIGDGQSADIAIATEGTAAHLVPSSALTLDDQGDLGLRVVAEDNLVAFYPVTLLRDTPDGALVTGLPDQVDIIIVGQEFVSHGGQVVPVSIQDIPTGQNATIDAARSALGGAQ